MAPLTSNLPPEFGRNERQNEPPTSTNGSNLPKQIVANRDEEFELEFPLKQES
jgi:hypothetical protein